MNKLTKWMPDIDGGYYKAVEVDKAIKTLEDAIEVVRRKFQSSNDVPVDRITLNRSEVGSVLGEEG